MCSKILSNLQTDDEYFTPKKIWEDVVDYLPTNGEMVVFEAFYGNGMSGQYLTELGCTVIQGPHVDFFKSDNDDSPIPPDKYDCIISNIPFSMKKEVLEKLKQLDKPFMIIMPSSTMHTQYLREIFENTLQMIIPNTRMHFEKDGVVLKRTSFDCAYYCYKMNLPKDIIWL